MRPSRLFVAAMVTLTSCLALACDGPPAQKTEQQPAVATGDRAAAPATATLFIDGGNAFVFRPDYTGATVGPIEPGEGGPHEHYNHSQLGFVVEEGTVTHTTTAPAEGQREFYKEENGRPVLARTERWWPTRGYTIQLCPDGTCPAAASSGAGSLVVEKGSDLDCTAQRSGIGTMIFPAAAHANATVRADWSDRLASRLQMIEGTLVVRGEACVQLRKAPTDTTAPRRVANGGPKEAALRIPRVKKWLDIVFTSADGSTHDYLRVTPADGRVTLRIINQKDAPRIAPGKPIDHYQQFYDLLVLPKGESRRALYWTPYVVPGQAEEGEAATPSPTECPSAGFESDNALTLRYLATTSPGGAS